jgi:hypothetical protein
MRDIDDFLPEVLIFAPNCAEPLALKYIREAARDLCHNARLWRDTASVTLAAPDYESLGTSTDAEIVDIEQAAILDDNGAVGRPLEPKTMAWLNVNRPNWVNDPTSGGASYVFQINPNTVSVFPRQAATLQLQLVLQPSLEAQVLPDWLYALHRTVIGRGAAAKALMTPSEWANPQLGGVMHDDFTSRIASVKTEFTKGQQGARLRSQAAWF